MKIIITGSLGNIGKPLTQKLTARGHDITVISRNADKNVSIEMLGARPAIGKLEDTSFLTETFTGADAVFCMVPPDFSQPDQMLYYEKLGHCYADAIRESGIRSVVLLSSYGAHLPSGTGFITGSYRTEQIFNTIPNITLSILRPTFFYYNLLAFTGMIKAAGFIGAVYGGRDKLAMVSPLDIATAAAEELQAEEHVTRIRYVNSDEKTCDEVAAVLGKALDMPDLKWIALPKSQVQQALLERGLSPDTVMNLVELGEALHTGRLLEDYTLHRPTFGKVKLEEYATEFANIFRSHTNTQ
jgi:uncharacterized protein YbjT (DUF2867 family)